MEISSNPTPGLDSSNLRPAHDNEAAWNHNTPAGHRLQEGSFQDICHKDCPAMS